MIVSEAYLDDEDVEGLHRGGRDALPRVARGQHQRCQALSEHIHSQIRDVVRSGIKISMVCAAGRIKQGTMKQSEYLLREHLRHQGAHKLLRTCDDKDTG